MSAVPHDAEQNRAGTVVEDAPGADSCQISVRAPLRSLVF